MYQKFKNWIDTHKTIAQRSLVLQMISRYFKDGVGRSSAALAYYLLFSVFPLLILLSNLIGYIDITPSSLTNLLSPVLPPQVVSMMAHYLSYVQNNSNHVLLVFSIVFSIYFPWRVVKELMATVRLSYRLDTPPSAWKHAVKQILCTLIIPVNLVVSLALVVLGQHVVQYLLGFINPNIFTIPHWILVMWQYLRFFAAAFLMSISLAILYGFSVDAKPERRVVWPGVCFAIVCWILGSMAFSYYVENFAHYNVYYGTIGAFMVLLLWLYITATFFILGGELNAVVTRLRCRKVGLKRKNAKRITDNSSSDSEKMHVMNEEDNEMHSLPSSPSRSETE